MQTLCLQPEIAGATLRVPGRHQGREVDDWRDEQPGQDPARDPAGRACRARAGAAHPVLRQRRRHAALCHALGEYVRWTDDRRPRCASFGRTSTLHSTGSTSTATSTATASSSTSVARRAGIRNQGWKDSADAVTHRDGTLAPSRRSPWPRCRGTSTRAWLAAAELLRPARRDRARRRQSATRAPSLRQRFRRDWWSEPTSSSRWRSTPRSARCRPSPRTLGTASGPACSTTTRPGRSERGSCARTCCAAGACGR